MNTSTGELLGLECKPEAADVWTEDTLTGVRHKLEVRQGRAVRVVEPLDAPEARFRHSVLDLASPCPVGYEDIREAYAADLTAAGGAKCSDCEQGQLLRTYLTRVKERQALHAKPA